MAEEKKSKEQIIKEKKLKYHVHGNKGVYCGGEWIPIEECAEWQCPKQCVIEASNKPITKTQHANITESDDENICHQFRGFAI